MNEVIEFLLQYKRQRIRIENIEFDIQEVREMIESAKAITYSDMPKGSTVKKDLSDCIAKIEGQIDKLNEARAEAIKKKAVVLETINTLEDEEHKKLLKLKYITYPTPKWIEIANQMGYSESYTYKLHGEALKSLKIG